MPPEGSSDVCTRRTCSSGCCACLCVCQPLGTCMCLIWNFGPFCETNCGGLALESGEHQLDGLYCFVSVTALCSPSLHLLIFFSFSRGRVRVRFLLFYLSMHCNSRFCLRKIFFSVTYREYVLPFQVRLKCKYPLPVFFRSSSTSLFLLLSCSLKQPLFENMRTPVFLPRI